MRYVIYVAAIASAVVALSAIIVVISPSLALFQILRKVTSVLKGRAGAVHEARATMSDSFLAKVFINMSHFYEKK